MSASEESENWSIEELLKEQVRLLRRQNEYLKVEVQTLKDQLNGVICQKHSLPLIMTKREASTSNLLVMQKTQTATNNNDKQYYIPFPISQTEMFTQLVEEGALASIPTRPWKPPYPAWFDENARCSYHDGATGNPTENCFYLHRKICELVNGGVIKFFPLEDFKTSTS
jgi:hypothetical protein